MVALFRVSQALKKVPSACKLHRMATSLKEVEQRVQNLETWWCNQTQFVHCASEKPGTRKAESGLQTMLCSVMLAQSRSQICQGTDMSCCGHLHSLKKVQTLVNSSSLASIDHMRGIVASGLIQKLHCSCRSATHSLEADATRKATCFDLQHQGHGTNISTCPKQEIHLSFSCPFPFASTSLRKNWDEEARPLFKIILQNVLRSVYQLNLMRHLC